MSRSEFALSWATDARLWKAVDLDLSECEHRVDRSKIPDFDQMKGRVPLLGEELQDKVTQHGRRSDALFSKCSEWLSGENFVVESDEEQPSSSTFSELGTRSKRNQISVILEKGAERLLHASQLALYTAGHRLGSRTV